MATYTTVLKQHTPMWHFQCDQPGCTLRATELKPKLDKFLIARLIEKHGNVPDDYWVDPLRKSDKDFHALDYKVSIIPSDDSQGRAFKCFPKTRFSLFFANTGQDDENQKFPVYYENILVCRFFSLNEQLISLIQENINAFFASTNFGTRQSKGFGSFLPKGLTNIDKLGASYKFSIDIKKEKENKKTGEIIHVQPSSALYFQDLFQQLETFYKILRSGNAIKRQRSLMENYVATLRDTVWDKTLFAQMIRNERISAKEHYLFRDLLGFSSTIEYRLSRDKGCKIEKSSAGMERFKSPLTFKLVEKCPYHFDVYIYISEIPAEMQKATFTATASRAGRTLGSMDLKFCPVSLTDYMKFVYKQSEDNKNGKRAQVYQKEAICMFKSLVKL